MGEYTNKNIRRNKEINHAGKEVVVYKMMTTSLTFKQTIDLGE
jgi:hypothetical protein